MRRPAMLFAALLQLSLWAGESVQLLADFEAPADLKAWECGFWTGRETLPREAVLSELHVTHGTKSVMIAPGSNFKSQYLPRDWSAYDELQVDVFVDGNEMMTCSILIGDEPWQKTRDYWDRHNSAIPVAPRQNTLTIPIHGLYRGEKSSRYHNLKTPIDPKQIVRLDLCISGSAAVKGVYIDNLRLVKHPPAPAGVLALDFGPEGSSVFPGFTLATHKTVYGNDGCKAGLKFPSRPARDDTFPTRLYQDYLEPNDNEFIADLPDGKYHVWLVYEECGFWGGENARYNKRWIENFGQEVWAQDLGPEGMWDYLFRFEHVEPQLGQSTWDTYMKDLFGGKRFVAQAKDGQLRLRFKAEPVNGARHAHNLAALCIWPESMKEAGHKWIDQVELRNRDEFDKKVACMGPTPKPLPIPADAQAKGYWLGFPTLEDQLTAVDAPGKPEGQLERSGARDQRLSFTFAVRPLKDFGPAKLTVSDLSGPAGTIPAAEIQSRYVHQAMHRGSFALMYTIGPETVRLVEKSKLQLSKDSTRQFWIVVHIPAEAKAGIYGGEVRLSAGEFNLTLPLKLEVLDLKLDEPDYILTYAYAGPMADLPEQRRKSATQDFFRVLREGGMNSHNAGPQIGFTGLDSEGKPKLDFTAVDEYFKAAKAAGLNNKTIIANWTAMVSGIMEGFREGNPSPLEKTLGKPFPEILKIVWTAVKEHAEKEGWPTINYYWVDEPRIAEPAQKVLNSLKAYREHVPWVRIGGYYSVHWDRKEPLDDVLREMFKTLVWNSMNIHTQTDIDKAKEYGNELYIYNQVSGGRNYRYVFGAYNYAEMRKGIKGLVEWAWFANSGYQFFDLDARECDVSMMNYGRHELFIPTIRYLRAQEGSDDLRFAVTLQNAAEKKKETPAGKAALEFLDGINAQIAVDQRHPPANFMGEESFRNRCIELWKALQK